ncbi:TRAP transporter small permease [Testudinibacter aquarius]|uniref:TRAP transporter small permease protein n=2 Tax=Testudinibacter aquarius TaxID=1524974 RepID=A0A4R3Y8T7_9PAST|nr:TRAP transporter small permease [Testudinibacter aquarius]TCV87991.1 TRAP-type C4-dicarboxylate transport system permease small subunit [Testudinibacter aquarius]
MILKNIEFFLSKINEPIGKIGKQLGGLLLIIMTIIVLIQVVSRYIFNDPISWSDELSCYLMIYMTYLCMPFIYLKDKNIAMTFLLEKAQGNRFFHVLMMLIHIFALVTILIWIYFGWNFFLRGNVMANSLPFKMYYIYIMPPVLFSITLLSVFQKIISELNNFISFEKIDENKGV